MDLALLTSIVVAATSVVLAVLTYQLAVETKLLRKAGTDPSLSVHIEAGERHVNAIFLVIRNHGRGTAYDVKWTVTPDAKTLEAHGVELRSLKLLDGLSQIASGQKIETFFGMAFGMLNGEGCPPITIEATYRDAHGTELKDRFVLSPRQFEGLTRLGQSIGEDVADSLKKIVKLLENVTPEGKLHVATSSEHPSSSRARRVRMTVGQDAHSTEHAARVADVEQAVPSARVADAEPTSPSAIPAKPVEETAKAAS
jgi:hypothetical protein